MLLVTADVGGESVVRGGCVNDRSRILVGAVLGAAIGGLAGFLFLTEQGGRVRREMEPRLDDLTREVRRLRSTFEKARTAASEGWRALSDLTGEARGAEWPGQSRQTSPF
jgi:gas vesicle protein